jgi:hypothetical protein
MLVLLSALLLGSWLCFSAGRRGFFAFDQSIVFDGGYRVAAGQVPYRDFVAPYGLVLFWVQGLVFRVLGVSYTSYLVTSAVSNALAAVSAAYIVQRLFPAALAWSAVAALLTAVWFYPLIGTPWFENSAHLCGMLALACLVARPSSPWPLLAAGVLAGLALGCKPNAGLLQLPVLGAALVLTRARGTAARPLGLFCAGLAAILVAGAAWLFLRSDPEALWKFAFAVPGEEARTRLSAIWPRGLVGCLVGAGRDADGVAVGVVRALAAAVCVVGGLVAWRNRADPGWRPYAAAAAVALLAFLDENVMGVTTNNAPQNNLPFLGLELAIAGATGEKLLRSLALGPESPPLALPPRALWLWLHNAAASIAVVLLASVGLDAAFSRKAHGIFAGSRFAPACQLPALSILDWADRTLLQRRRGGELTCADLERVVRILEERGEPFFVMGDATILHGLVGRPSPAPLLWYHQGLTYPRAYDAELDLRQAASLASVATIVVESNAWMQGVERRLGYFRELARAIEERFTPGGRVGVFQILERKPETEER